MKKNPAYLVLVFVLASQLVLAQNTAKQHKLDINIPEVALLGIVHDGSENLSFSKNSPTEAGESINLSTAEDKGVWLNYSSIVRNEKHSRKVTAKVEGQIPAGLKVVVEASEIKGSGNGKLGISTGNIELSDQPKEIIGSIGSCYTGKGVNNGHLLKFKIEYENDAKPDNLIAANHPINVIYTLTD